MSRGTGEAEVKGCRRKKWIRRNRKVESSRADSIEDQENQREKITEG